MTKWIMEASIDGIGRHHLTSIFLISIFQYKQGANANPDDPNYDMKQLALTSFATMGCRTLIGYDRHGLGDIWQERGNNVPNTIILPKLGIEFGICLGKRTKPDLDGFWKTFEETLKLTEKDCSLKLWYSSRPNLHP